MSEHTQQCDSWSIAWTSGQLQEFDVLSAAIATGRTAYSAATGSPQPLKVSAQAVSLKRAREDFERGGRARRG